MLIGYARISTGEQTLDLQRGALIAAGCERTFEDVASGAKADRPGLEEALAYARNGDALPNFVVFEQSCVAARQSKQDMVSLDQVIRKR